MKIRNGFVSNSSSSSFIVIFDKRPKTIEELKELMFPGMEMQHKISLYGNGETISSVVSTVFRDIEEQEKGKIETLIQFRNEFNDYSNWNGKLEVYRDKYTYTDEKITTELKEKIKKFEPLTKQYYNGDKDSPEWTEFSKKYQEYQYEIYDLCDKLAESDFNEFINDVKDKYIAHFEYDDGGGNLSSLMEHYGIFDNLDHMKFSHH